MMETKCRKCGDYYFKKEHKDKYIKGYTEDSSLCPMCNATESVIGRLKNKESFSVDDLRKLPKHLIFDPQNDNPGEAAYGLQFRQMVEKLL